MRLIHPVFENPFIFEENTVNVLVIENGKTFYQLTNELLNQINGENGGWVLSDENKVKDLNLEKTFSFIIEPYTLDFNNKKIQNKLLAKLKDIAVDSEHYLLTNDIIGQNVVYIEKLIESIDYSLEYNNMPDINSLLKIFEIRLRPDYDSVLEKIIEYLKVVNQFLSINSFVFLNLKSYLTSEELESFYKDCFYNKYNLFLIESTDSEYRFDCEKHRIIDKDLCEI